MGRRRRQGGPAAVGARDARWADGCCLEPWQVMWSKLSARGGTNKLSKGLQRWRLRARSAGGNAGAPSAPGWPARAARAPPIRLEQPTAHERTRRLFRRLLKERSPLLLLRNGAMLQRAITPCAAGMASFLPGADVAAPKMQAGGSRQALASRRNVLEPMRRALHQSGWRSA